MTDQKRSYTKKVRAELEEQTRLRITESAVELHGTLRPARTSMSAVAERAGVRRSTLYRHFPDERALFEACSAHWGERNPPPDPGAWSRIGDPELRLRTALGEIYAWYRQTERMLANLLRDEATMPVVRERFQAYHAFLGLLPEPLLAGRRLRGRARRRAQAATGHALAFSTWRSLTGVQGLSDEEASDLMTGLVAASSSA